MLNRSNPKDSVKSQFPDFYSEYGPIYIEFLKVYYAWMESNKYTAPAKEIPTLLDIDTTEDLFLNYFKKEYMNSMPESVLGDQRFLQKHILDLYRSKGSHEGLRLLFRLLYNKEIDIYIPGKDMFRLSNSKWVQRKYMEISNKEINKDLIGKQITGEISKATAFVESYENIIYNGKKNNILWISHIAGEFKRHERIYNSINEINDSPKILGSLTGMSISYSSNDLSKGQIFYDSINSDLEFVVSSIDTIEDVGVINPEITVNGSGYRETFTDVSVVKRGIPGTGAEFIIGPIVADLTLSVSNVALAPYANTNLNAADYAMPGISPANTTTIIGVALQFQTYNVGPISTLITLDPGIGYDEIVDIYANDTEISDLEIDDGNGGFLGNNAVILGYPDFGINKAETVTIISSLFNYEDGVVISLTNGAGKIISGRTIVGAVGQLEGYYQDDNSFLSNKKFLQDSFYYQEYSYDIKSNETFSQYENILEKTVHPSGKKAFGNIRHVNNVDQNTQFESLITEN